MIEFSNIHRERAFFYSPLSFLRNHDEQLIDSFCSNLIEETNKNTLQIIGSKARCFFKYLEWDSAYLNYPTYRLEFFDWDVNTTNLIEDLIQCITDLKKELSERHPHYYLFADIPSEDLKTIQAVGSASFRLIETRLTYYHDELAHYSWGQRYNVRQAIAKDIPNLRVTAMENRNSYDRLHADSYFTDALADEYIGTYIENSVKGFSDIILVPDEPTNGDNLPGAFFAADLISAEKSPLKITSGSIVLTAAGSTRRGWHLKLMSEMCLYFQKHNVQIAYMKTQPTNGAVIRNCEKLGWKYGKCSHVFSFHG